jgi:hypothetical protein
MRSPNPNQVAGEQPQKSVLQIIPKVSTEICSVSNYAFHLAKKLWQDSQISSHFLVCQVSDRASVTQTDFPVLILPQKTSKSFLEQIPPEVTHILLHYSGAAYAKGKMDAPFWLQEGLQAVRRSRQVQVLVIFHDMPVAEFQQMKWVNPIGGMVAYRIAQQADVAIALNVRLQAILEKWLQREVRCLPQPDYLEKPPIIPPLRDRYRRAVVLGSHSPLRCHQQKCDDVAQTCRDLGMQEIYDIAPTLQVQVATSPQFDWVDRGKMQPSEIGWILLNAWIGFFSAKTASHLERSETFAAYCAHGVVPIGMNGVPETVGSLKRGTHYLQIPVVTKTNEDRLQGVADRAHQWYRDRCWHRNAQFVAALIQKQ